MCTHLNIETEQNSEDGEPGMEGDRHQDLLKMQMGDVDVGVYIKSYVC